MRELEQEFRITPAIPGSRRKAGAEGNRFFGRVIEYLRIPRRVHAPVFRLQHARHLLLPYGSVAASRQRNQGNDQRSCPATVENAVDPQLPLAAFPGEGELELLSTERRERDFPRKPGELPAVRMDCSGFRPVR